MGFKMERDELFRAACCNLGEAFQNNPSVDVSYSDAATGARQIRLLGLSGSYVGMLTETQPNFFGAAKNFALGYIPGPWMESISVSKGASGVKNGFEGIAGLINVQYLEPSDDEGATISLYGDDDSRIEANADANIHLGQRLSTVVLGHYDERWGEHDGNGDGFIDNPSVRQFNLQNRWLYQGRNYIFHGGIGALSEDRTFGQRGHTSHSTESLWRGETRARRLEGYMKHALLFGDSHDSNIALMASLALHNQDATYGKRYFDVKERDLTASLIFETSLSRSHSLSAGASFERHFMDEDYLIDTSSEATVSRDGDYGSGGLYGQYTLNLSGRLVVMLGLRGDLTTHTEDEKALIMTPRMHLKWQISDHVQLRASAGKGYRLANAFLAENTSLLAMGREIEMTSLRRESAWNFGGTLGFDIPLGGRTLKVNAEYFCTTFQNQTVVDYDTDTSRLMVYDLDSELGGSDPSSYSHVIQLDATYEPLEGITATLAFRRNIVKTTYGGVLMDKALSPKYKGLLTISLKPGLGLWQVDGSLQLVGPARLPKSSVSDGTEYTKAYPQAALQVTRWFRHFSLYAGGENLTGYRQKTPVISADDPFSAEFDATQAWAPVHGRMLYAGIRVNLGGRR